MTRIQRLGLAVSLGLAMVTGIFRAHAEATAETNVFKAAADGIEFRHDVFPEPWSTFVLKIQLGRPDLKFLPVLGQFDRIGLNTLSAQVRQVPARIGEPVAAINGDFYKTEGEPMPGDPRGLFVSRGELISGPVERDCVWFGTNGLPNVGMIHSQFTLQIGNRAAVTNGLNEAFDGSQPVIYSLAGSSGAKGGKSFIMAKSGAGPWLPLRLGMTYHAVLKERLDEEAPVPDDALIVCLPTDLGRAVQAGDEVTFSTATSPNLRGVDTAIGGGPAILRDGQTVEAHIGKPNERHPRTAMGWNETHMFFVVVDGRQTQSVGMTLAELSKYMAGLGCKDAMNLDGGGSTEMILNGKIVNSPCFGSERSCATSLIALRPAAPKTRPGTAIRD
ncbi:MAG TPA: phosphodiester glycosidase family protein [Candidatus Limnocylindria bacterium]|jgi:hypothetical protein|nr:phosphodiester glycosidase family protein [Candidatus Limnocylindria bacterium]